jgi:hypothetical protein
MISSSRTFLTLEIQKSPSSVIKTEDGLFGLAFLYLPTPPPQIMSADEDQG